MRACFLASRRWNGAGATVSGSLIFGIGTQSNNGLGSAKVLTVDPATGNLTTVFKNKSYVNSYVDAGSNALFFGNGIFADCSGAYAGFYCPATEQNLSATMQGVNGAASAVTFSVANAQQLTTANPSYNAFNNLAASDSNPTEFAWGLPFFYGRSVFTAIEGRSTPAGAGPYVAF